MLVARVIPGGLARGEVEIVDVPRHILTVGEEEVGRGEGGSFQHVQKAPGEGGRDDGWMGRCREDVLSCETERFTT